MLHMPDSTPQVLVCLNRLIIPGDAILRRAVSILFLPMPVNKTVQVAPVLLISASASSLSMVACLDFREKFLKMLVVALVQVS